MFTRQMPDQSSRVADGLNAALASGQRMLAEYKPFEPAFYHTDIADWGMALLFARCRSAGVGAGRYRSSLSVAEHRADPRMATAPENVRWSAWSIMHNSRRCSESAASSKPKSACAPPSATCDPLSAHGERHAACPKNHCRFCAIAVISNRSQKIEACKT